MPEIIYSHEHEAWIKECYKCDRTYEVQAKNITEAEERMLEFFYAMPNNRYSVNGLMSNCRECIGRRTRGGNGTLTRHEILESQDGKCALCSTEVRIGTKGGACMDHDHLTGNDRGVLCYRCNIRMGGVDDEEWLIKAIVYRDSFRCE